jgi:probable rRNA maturation factor
VIRAVGLVLERERRAVRLSIAFVGPDRINALNARWKGVDRPTDVLAFALDHPDGGLTGDVYICPAVATREAAQRGIARREELLRLVIHGVLHVLGYDHPEDERRTRSAMWRRQERYLACLV